MTSRVGLLGLASLACLTLSIGDGSLRLVR